MKNGRKKLTEITNTSTSKILDKYGEPEECTIHPDEAIHDLDVVDTRLLEEGIFDDYQIEYLQHDICMVPPRFP